MTNAVSLAQQASTGVSQGFKNRIINGAMVIDQRNAGTYAAYAAGSYIVDRFLYTSSQASKLVLGQNLGVAPVTPPAGFVNYLGAQSQSAYTVGASEIFAIIQVIEGYNIADLGWGTANAQTITLSFWARSSLTGTFGGALNNGGFRSYPFTYTISSANTWTKIAITIPGDTSGTWGSTNLTGVQVWFSLGVGSTYSGTASAWSGSNFVSATGATSVVGTNGATWYITGVQFEVGSTATSFEYRQFTTELQLASRYFQTTYNLGTALGTASTGSGVVGRTLDAQQSYPTLNWCMPVAMRTTPTVTYYSPITGASGKAATQPNGADIDASNFGYDGTKNVALICNAITVPQSYGFYAHFACSAEL